MKFDRPNPPQKYLNLPGMEGVLAFVSDGRVEYPKPGWFLHLVGAKVHWYDPVKVQEERMLRRLCDGAAAFPANLFEPGNWPSCMHCRRIIRGSRP